MKRFALVVALLAACAPKAPEGPRKPVEIEEFIDFECPYCRSLHASLAPLVAKEGARVHVTRHHVPLAMHPHAAKAARAAVCAEAEGEAKGDAMAEALMKAAFERMSDDDYLTMAERAGVSRDGFIGCVNAESTTARLTADAALFRSKKVTGLPLVYIDGEPLEGDQDPDVLQGAIDKALGR